MNAQSASWCLSRRISTCTSSDARTTYLSLKSGPTSFPPTSQVKDISHVRFISGSSRAFSKYHGLSLGLRLQSFTAQMTSKNALIKETWAPSMLFPSPPYSQRPFPLWSLWTRRHLITLKNTALKPRVSIHLLNPNGFCWQATKDSKRRNGLLGNWIWGWWFL